MPFHFMDSLHTRNRTAKDWEQDKRTRELRSGTAQLALPARLTRAKRKAEENAATQAEQLKRYPGAAESYLAQWPVDWRACARKEAAHTWRTSERREPRTTPDDWKAPRYLENFESCFRTWRYVSDITRGAYTRRVDSDWYCDSDGHRTARAIVLSLPHGRFLPAIRFEEHKYKDSGCLIEAGRNFETDEQNAALMAARFAERVAEKERDYSEAWNAGAEAQGLREEVDSTRGELLESLAEMRAARKLLKQEGVAQLPSVCNAMRSHVRASLRGISRARKRIAELRDNYGKTEGFHDAFNA